MTAAAEAGAGMAAWAAASDRVLITACQIWIEAARDSEEQPL